MTNPRIIWFNCYFELHLLYKILEVLLNKRVEATPKAINEKEGALNKIGTRRNAQMVSPFYIIFYINISRVQSLITLCGYESQTDLFKVFILKKDPPNLDATGL